MAEVTDEHSQVERAESSLVLPRDVLYSMSSRIGGHGVDVDCHEGLKAAWRADVLSKAIVFENRQHDVPPFMIRTLERSPIKLASFLSRSYYHGAKRKYLDRICARAVRLGCFDLVHSRSGDCFETFHEARRRGVATLLQVPTCHRDSGCQEPPVSGIGFPRRWLHRLLPSRRQIIEEYALADLIIVRSQKAFETFLACDVPRDKLYKLPSGTDTLRFTPSARRDEFAAVFVGSIEKRTGADLLLKVWRRLRLKNATLTLLGGVQEEMKPVLAQYSGDDVRIVGHGSDLETYYRQSSVHISPGTCEGNGQATYDAAASGLPQIATREAGDVVVDGENGLLVPCGDEHALAAAVQKLYDNRDLCHGWGQAGRNRVMTNFTWEHYHERLLKAYALALQMARC